MDTKLNIEVRVITRDAIAQIRQLEKQTAAYEAAIAKASLANKSTSGGGFFTQLGRELNGAASAFRNAETTAGKFSALGGGLRGVWSSMTSGMGSAIGKLGAFNDGLIKTGKNLQWAGRQIEYRFSLPLLLAGGAAVKWALANEAAFTQLSRVYTDLNGSSQEVTHTLSQLQRAFRDLSDIYGIQQSDIIGIGVQWARLGAKGAALAQAVNLTAKAMVLGNVSANDAATGLIALQQVYHLTIAELGGAVDTINAIANRSHVGFDDLFTAVQRGAATARQAGVSIEEYASMVASLVPATGSASIAGRSLQTIMSRLFTPTKASAEVMKLMGINVYGASFQAKNGTQRLQEMAGQFAKLTPAQKLFTSTTIASRFQVGRFAELMDQINTKTSNYNRLLHSTGNAQKNAAESTRDISKILASQPKALSIATNEIKNAAAQAIIPLIPAILGVTRLVAKLIISFTRLSPKTQEFFLMLLAGVAIAGPLISTFGAFGVLLGIIGKTALLGAKGVHALLTGFGLLEKKTVATGLEKTIGDAVKSGQSAGEAYVGSTVAAVEEGSPSITGAATSLWGIVGTQASTAADAAGTGAAMTYTSAVLSSLGSFGGETIATETASIFAAAAVGIDSVAATAGETAGAAYLGGLVSAIVSGGSAFGAAAGADIAAAAPAIFASASTVGQAAGVAFDIGVATGMAEGVEIKAAAGVADFLAAAPAIIAAAGEVGVAAGVALDVGAAAGITAGAPIALAGLEAAVGELGAAAAAIGPEVAGAAVASIEGVGGELVAAGTVLGTAVIDGVESSIVAIGSVIPDAIDAVSTLVASSAESVGGEAAAGVIGGLEALPTGVTQIIGAALAAGLLVFTLFGSKIKSGFSTIVTDIGSALAALPRVMGDVLIGVWNVVVSIGKAIWQALRDFLNPFERHSPSLVDLVTSGVDIIAQKYHSLRSISGDLRSAIADMRQFKNETKGVNNTVRNLDFAKNRAKIQKYQPGLVGVADRTFNNIKALEPDLDRVTAAYARQQIIVGKWQQKLDRANDSLDAQQYILNNEQAVLDGVSAKLDNAKSHLDKVINKPLKGENAATAAIYKNELATKKWQLALVSLETSYGSLDNIKQKMADINGELELLRGNESDLHLKGAGSDILGPLQAQEAALRAQQRNLGGVATQMTNYQTTIDKLDLSGQKLQLTFDTTFGDMHHQIDTIANAQKEITFKDAIAGTRRWKPVVDALTIAYDKQNVKVKAQEGVVRGLTAARDKIQHSYDLENKKLTGLGKVYDAIDQQINEMTSALSGLASAATEAAGATDTIGAGFDAAGAGKFAIPKVPIPDAGNLDKLIKQWENQIDKSFGHFKLGDVFTAPFKAAWHKLQDWWTSSAWPWIQRIPGNVGSFLTSASTWSGLLHIFEIPFKAGWALLSGWWTQTAQPWLAGLPGRIGSALSGLPGMIGTALKAVGNAIISPFKAAWKYLGGGKGSIPFQIGHMVGMLALLPVKIIAALAGLAIKLVRWLGGTFNTVVAAIPGAVAGFIGWFKNMPQHIISAIVGTFHLGSLIVNWLNGAIAAIIRALPTVFSTLVNWFSRVPGLIAAGLGDVAGALKDVFAGAWNAFTTWWNEHIAGKGIHIKSFDLGFIHTPKVDFSLPTLDAVQLATGGVARATSGGTLARIAEAGHAEMVAPLPHGFSMGRMNSTLMRLERFVDNKGNTTSMQPVVNNNKTIHFHGDLSFPNIEDGADAEKLIRNLEAMAD